MKTIKHNGVVSTLIYKTNTGIYLRSKSDNVKPGQYGADIYNIDGDDGHIVLVATSGRTGGELKNTVTVVSVDKYEEILDVYDPYDPYPYHKAIMNELGFEII